MPNAADSGLILAGLGQEIIKQDFNDTCRTVTPIWMNYW